jgi:hypothetical protein
LGGFADVWLVYMLSRRLMKRILQSVAVGFVLVTAYMMFSSVTFMLAGEHKELVPYLDLPVRLPKAVFFYLSPPIAEDFSPMMNQRKIFLIVFFYLANVLLYSIPAYILVRLISRRRRRFDMARMGSPPPPTFVN